jgi:uncharacterized protein
MSPVVMYQKWRDLLFLHWPLDAAQVQASLPPGLTVDCFAGQAWLGLVPFRMRAIRPRFLPAIPYFSNFLETNVRTYVRDAQGRPGVWFYSLDANRQLAVWAARRFFSLPYFSARMQCGFEADGWIDYRSARRQGGPPSRFRYRAQGPGRLAEIGSLEHFLIERYRLYARQARQQILLTGEVEHAPYPLHDAELNDFDPGLLALAGFPDVQGPPAHALFSPGVDVRVRRVEKA